MPLPDLDTAKNQLCKYFDAYNERNLDTIGTLLHDDLEIYFQQKQVGKSKQEALPTYGNDWREGKKVSIEGGVDGIQCSTSETIDMRLTLLVDIQKKTVAKCDVTYSMNEQLLQVKHDIHSFEML